MTTLQPQAWECTLCGAESNQVEIRSTNELQPPDLDLRPGEMYRSTMSYWVHRCPRCGYVADADSKVEAADLPESAGELVALVHSEEYRAQLRDSEFPETAQDLLCRASLVERLGRPTGAGWHALQAAWACDDERSEGAARRCRERVLELWIRAEEDGTQIVDDGFADTQLLFADVLRRAGRFEEARQRCHRGLSGRPEDPLRSLLEYEIELISREDTEAHSIGEVLGRRDPG